MSFSIEQLHYLQRTGDIVTGLEPGNPTIEAPLDLRVMWQIKGIGVVEKQLRRDTAAATPPHMPTLELLMGLYGFRVPISFLIRSEGDKLSISIGTFLWRGQVATSEQAKRILAARNQMIRACLGSVFRGADILPADPAVTVPEAAGIVLGIPTVKPPDPSDGALAMDRLCRALSGAPWGCLIMAEPMTESETGTLRLTAVDSLKAIQFYVSKLPYPDPLANHYSTLLEATVNDYTYGLAIGSWRTNVYLLGSESGYGRLAAVWQGIFTGDQSMHMPIRIVRKTGIPRLVTEWRISDKQQEPGPGGFRHRYGCQTILTSDQLAAYIHLPRLETNGFSISLIPSFDSSPAIAELTEPSLAVGNIISDRRTTNIAYSLPLRQLRGHMLIAGVTDTGKTTTLLNILSQADRMNVPFLVVEPAKAEYRALLNKRDFRQPLRVFTLGNERVSPFRLNPFEPVKGISVSVHLDLLRSAFNASFGMWNPLPQVLERALHAVYADRGWEMASNINARPGAAKSRFAYPTLSGLLRKIDEITPSLGYDEKIASDIRAALRTRISSLCTGGKGRMLDVRTSIPETILFGGSAIIELEEMGDDDDKAFVIALILIRSWEYLKTLGETSSLRHLLVIEEAHRLLTNVAVKGSEEGNPRGKAVESFTNILSEIRAYGQGVVIVDQVPVRLAPDAIKNTNTKIVHRVVAVDDRTVLAGAMMMTEQQSQALAMLETGEAAIFTKGDDSPLLVKIQKIAEDVRTHPNDVAVARAMEEFRKTHVTFHWECAASLETQHACDAARSVAEGFEFQRELSRLVLSSVGDHMAATRLWPGLLRQIEVARRGRIDLEVMLKCTIARASELLADEWGAYMSWSYSDVEMLAVRLRALLLELSENGTASLPAFLECLNTISLRTFSPYSQCDEICDTIPHTCLFRHAASRVAKWPTINAVWRTAVERDEALRKAAAEGVQGDDGQPFVRRRESWLAALDAAQWIVDGDGGSDAERRAALCFSQQMLHLDRDLLINTREDAIFNIMAARFQIGNTSV